ncbi:BTAD domain-containing putative transcriptional regulator [Streptomyces sp. Da 82-17]|uniref:AfsR/SARP family transcriptional regulator n=1 Tax=Streptomyces sp. Da 82-17 TaxID=3377116 RepID=UPI0038D41F92
MHIRVLGAIEAELNGRSILPTAGKPRQLLALLAFHSNQVVPVSRLMEEIWSDAPPRSAPTTLQTYILQIRRRVDEAMGGPRAGACAKELLTTRHEGYQLRLEPDRFDLHVYNLLTAEGRRAEDLGDDEAAARRYRAALALWRGHALADLRTGPLLAVERMRLEESRLGLVERRIEVELRLGLHAELVTELAALTAQHPLHENLHAQLIVAHYRSGRPSAALRVFQTLRTALVEELGIEPSARLQRLHQAVLLDDPGLLAERAAGRMLDRYPG